MPDLSRSGHAPRDFRHGFLAVCALVFGASAALTIAWSARMQEMGGMHMRGGWTLSPMWMRMPGHGWSGAAVSFVGMWAAMMIAMMLPSLAPELLRFRDAARVLGATRAELLTALVAASYFLVWTTAGAIAFPLGAGVAALIRHLPALARAVPLVTGGFILIVGALRMVESHRSHLVFRNDPPLLERAPRADCHAAGRYGLRLGLRCVRGCAAFMAILLAVGMMDLRAMSIVTTAITLERLAPGAASATRAIGVVTAGTGLILIARALEFGLPV